MPKPSCRITCITFFRCESYIINEYGCGAQFAVVQAEICPTLSPWQTNSYDPFYPENWLMVFTYRWTQCNDTYYGAIAGSDYWTPSNIIQQGFCYLSNIRGSIDSPTEVTGSGLSECKYCILPFPENNGGDNRFRWWGQAIISSINVSNPTPNNTLNLPLGQSQTFFTRDNCPSGN